MTSHFKQIENNFQADEQLSRLEKEEEEPKEEGWSKRQSLAIHLLIVSAVPTILFAFLGNVLQLHYYVVCLILLFYFGALAYLIRYRFQWLLQAFKESQKYIR